MNARVLTEAPRPIEVQQLQQHPLALQGGAAASLVAAERPATVSVLALLERAVERGMSVEALTQLMALSERMQAVEARRAFDAALSAFRGEVLEILKTEDVSYKPREGPKVEYSHASLAGVIEVLGPALSRHGFSFFWTPEQSPGWVSVTCHLRHKAGHSEQASMGGPEDKSGGKNSIQAVISTVSYLERHTLKAVCGVAEKKDDRDDGRPPGGAADEDAWEGVPTGLRKAAEQAAAKGEAAYAAFFAATGKPNRKLLSRQHPGLKAQAEKATKHQQEQHEHQ